MDFIGRDSSAKNGRKKGSKTPLHEHVATPDEALPSLFNKLVSSGLKPSVRATQYESELTTSPCALEASCQIVIWFVLAFKNRTEPSAIATLAPPG